MEQILGPKMRWLLVAGGPINLGFLAMFAPPAVAPRRAVDFPEPPVFISWILAAWIFAFGVAYFWMGWTFRMSRPMLAVGATGKAAFGLGVIALLLTGELSVLTTLVAVSDLVLAAIFFGWLLRRG